MSSDNMRGMYGHTWWQPKDEKCGEIFGAIKYWLRKMNEDHVSIGQWLCLVKSFSLFVRLGTNLWAYTSPPEALLASGTRGTCQAFMPQVPSTFNCICTLPSAPGIFRVWQHPWTPPFPNSSSIWLNQPIYVAISPKIRQLHSFKCQNTTKTT